MTDVPPVARATSRSGLCADPQNSWPAPADDLAQDLAEAASQGLISHDQAQALHRHLVACRDRRQLQAPLPRFKPAHILVYLGGLIAIGAMTLFMTLAWEQFGGWGLLAIATAYATACAAATEGLLRRGALALPAGVLGSLAVAMVPLAVYGLQVALGLWPEGGADRSAYRDFHRWVDARWVVMELATLLAGAVALWRWRQPFGVMPVAVTLWYISMDLAPLLLGGDPQDFFSKQGRFVSMAVGLATLAAALAVDLRSRSRRDFAFWLYLVGALAFWGALSAMDSRSEWGKLLYALINLGLIAVGAALGRRVFAVLGGLGLAGYLGHLSHTVFKDSLGFPLALSALGLAIVAAGVWWQRHEAAIGLRLRSAVPAGLREALDRRDRRLQA